ncbi:hypothetical protein [Alteromonas flava]|uniref:hypothetical protein n=1 Tax=Alteromonas flava TaxID=2048003 RepID=UPI000C28BCCA|nr:hypothetical protein [Alteromonas flava]
MNKLINIILSGLLWRRYKFLLITLIITVLSIILVGQIHADYLSYSVTTEDPAVGWSFVLKWAAWLVLVIVFLVANQWYNARKEALAEQRKPNSALQRLLKRKSRTSSAAHSETGNEQQDAIQSEDPFAHLRHKEKLRSYADIVIEKKPEDK